MTAKHSSKAKLKRRVKNTETDRCRLTDRCRTDYPKIQPQASLRLPVQTSAHQTAHSTISRHLVKDRQIGGDLYTHLRIVSKPYRRKYGSGARTKASYRAEPALNTDFPLSVKKSMSAISRWTPSSATAKKSGLVVAVERKTKFAVIRKISEAVQRYDSNNYLG